MSKSAPILIEAVLSVLIFDQLDYNFFWINKNKIWLSNAKPKGQYTRLNKNT